MKMFSVDEVAEMWGVTPKAVRTRIERRQIPFRRLKGRVFIPARDLEIFIESLPGLSAEEAVAHADKNADPTPLQRGGKNGARRTYKTDPKLVLLKYQANERLLDAFLRVVEGEAMVQHADRLLEQRQALLAAYGIEPLASPTLPTRATPLLNVETELPQTELSELLDGLRDMARP